MKNIICFGDSNTWGYKPTGDGRFDESERWTGILAAKLKKYGCNIYEEGLCGRTTVFDDLNRNGLNGSRALSGILKKYPNADTVILMLGTNDCKTAFHTTPKIIAEGIRTLVRQIYLNNPNMDIIIVSPILLGERIGESEFDAEFNYNSLGISKGLKSAYRGVAFEERCRFIAASDYAVPSDVDMQHMNAESHKHLAYALYGFIYKMIYLSGFFDFSKKIIISSAKAN